MNNTLKNLVATIAALVSRRAVRDTVHSVTGTIDLSDPRNPRGHCSACGPNTRVRPYKKAASGAQLYACRVSGGARKYNGYIKATACQNPSCALTAAGIQHVYNNLHVHHKHGDNTNSAKHEDLITLCAYCHDIVETTADLYIAGEVSIKDWEILEDLGLVTRTYLETSLQANR